MKKVVLAVVFLAIIVALSYYSASTHKEQTQVAYEHGRQESAHQIESLNKRYNLLADSIAQQEVEAAKLVWQRELAYRSAYDSLVKASNIEESKTGSRKVDFNSDAHLTEDGLLRHKQILGYYKKRYRDLPKDLSPYEKKVALAEIRDETARKFSISLEEFDKIRTENKLDY